MFRNYANIAAPLTELTRKQYKHDFLHYWKQQHDAAFDQLVQMLTSGPVLHLFDEDRPIRVETDASNQGMVAVLLQQVPDGQWKPVEFWSKKFNTAQRNYHPAEKETCAIVYDYNTGDTSYSASYSQLLPTTAPALICRPNHQNSLVRETSGG